MGKTERYDKMRNTGYFIWLSEIAQGEACAKKLYEYFGYDAEKIYKAELKDYLAAGLEEKEAEKFMNKDFSAANMILDFCAENNVGIITYSSAYYPQKLMSISDPPAVLYYRGRIEKLDNNICITCVGTRKCTDAGSKAGYEISYKLASCGVTVVTGLALGIDSACAKGSLDAGGFSVGVLGSGINVAYPFENADIFRRMFKDGLVITEFSPYTQPLAKNFPKRNRIMSALGNAVLVVEAGENSGALITAKIASELGRKIYAVPGSIENIECRGSNELIKEGAEAVTDYEDVLKDFKYLYPDRIFDHRVKMNEDSVSENLPEYKIPKRTFGKIKSAARKFFGGGAGTHEEIKDEDCTNKTDVSVLSEAERKVYEKFGEKELCADEIMCEDLSPKEVLSALTMLEIYGFIESVPGGSYRKIN